MYDKTDFLAYTSALQANKGVHRGRGLAPEYETASSWIALERADMRRDREAFDLIWASNPAFFELHLINTAGVFDWNFGPKHPSPAPSAE